MSDFVPPDMAIGGFLFAAAVVYAAWHEHRGSNPRDAKLLAATGGISLLGSAAAWFL